MSSLVREVVLSPDLQNAVDAAIASGAYRDADELVHAALSAFLQAKGYRQEEIYRLIVESAQEYAIFTTGIDGRITTWNVGAQRILGYFADEIIGKPIDIIFSKEDRQDQAVTTELTVALERGSAKDERWHMRKDGSLFWASGLMMPLRDGAGNIHGFLKILRDKTLERQEQEQRRVLLAELNHRVKNTLAQVQSLVIQTVRSSEDLKDYEEKISSRLVALAKAHDLLINGDWLGASLEQVIRKTLAAHTLDGRITLEGEQLRVPTTIAVALHMVLHELTTNAAKYGALSSPKGQLLIRWHVAARDSHETLLLDWQEADGPSISSAPAIKGFGTRLIERSVDELGGKVRWNFAPSGLHLGLEIPLSTKA
jgi:PAS domain S-box-containing protein